MVPQRRLSRPTSSLRSLLSGAASALLLVACAGAEAESESASDSASTSTSTTGNTGVSTSLATTSAGPSTSDASASASSTTDDSATSDASSSTGDSDSDSTSATTGTSDTTGASTDTDSDTDTDTDTDTTGVGVCEAAAWEVPSATEAELAAHDLLWVPCEMTVCGPDDAEPGQALLCADFALDGVPLEYLGHLHPNDSGAFTTDDVVSENSIAWLNGERHTYRYDDAVYILTEGDEALDQLDVYFTVRALETLRLEHPATYQALVVDTEAFPDGPTLDGLGWKNRHRSFVLSFDTSPLYIAAGLTILDKAPAQNQMIDEYSNVPAISIDRETILGVDDKIGSRPIYQKPGDDENFLRYAREGLAETLLHELLHRYIDRLNSTDAAMNDLYNRRVDPDACAAWELEETLVAAASLLHFRKAGGLGDAYLEYYDVVLDANLDVVKQCPDYAMWAETFASPSGVHERYDLRLLDFD